MPKYIVLAKYTQEGIAGFKGVKDRFAGAREHLAAMGISHEGMWVTMGQYDWVGLVDAPDGETMATWLLEVGQLNIASTETMRAFTEEEAIKLAERLK